MIWRITTLAAVVLTMAMLTGAGRAVAQTAEQPTVTTFSQYLRTQGYDITDAEAQYLDSDEQFQFGFAQALVNIDLLSRVDAEQRTDEWRQALIGELNRLIEADPNATPEAPSSLQRHRELGVTHRTQIREAARQWLAGVQAGDSEWLQRGGDQFRAAMETLVSWQQELMARFPPPEGQP